MRWRRGRAGTALWLACALAAPALAEAPAPTAPAPAEADGAAAPAPWPPPALPELPDRDPARASVATAWRLPASTLNARVDRAQRVAFALGIRELEGPARALLVHEELGDPRDRAFAAARLAPGLPAAHAALAQADLAAGDLRGAAKALAAAFRATPGNLEARAWLAAAGYHALTLAAFLLAAVFLFLAAAGSLPSLIHTLGASWLKLPGPAALALLGCFALLPALFEGPAGALLGLGALAIAAGGLSKRIAVALVCGLALLALHPGLDQLAIARVALSADPVAIAAHRVESGLATPAEVGTVRAAAARDPLAARAVALHTKRSGDLAAAREYFRHVPHSDDDFEVLNNTANVLFALGDVDGAIALYERADRLGRSPVVLFNLSQANGHAIRLDEQDRALIKAQSIDPRTLDHLTGVADDGTNTFVADLPVTTERVFARTAATGEPARLARALRLRVAPGWLGASLESAAALVAIVLIASIVGAGTFVRSVPVRDFYADIARTLQTGVGDSAQRVAQLTRLRRQRARTERLLTVLALVLPGAAGLRFGRPIPGLLAAFAFSGALAIALVGMSVPPDPLAVGVLPALLARLVLAVLACLYLVSTALAFVLRAEE